jgi:hypothetical protein
MYRIVHNPQTGLYRIEKRGWFGWNFVTDPASGDYLGFPDLAAARAWICERTQTEDSPSRRWKVVQDCTA